MKEEYRKLVKKKKKKYRPGEKGHRKDFQEHDP